MKQRCKCNINETKLQVECSNNIDFYLTPNL